MVKAPKELIDALEQVFKRFDVVMDVTDVYDGHDNYQGKDVEIRSNEIVNDAYPIYIDDMEELARIIN